MSKIIFSKGKPNKNLIYAISLLMFIVAGHNSVYSQTFVIEPQTGQIMSFGNIIVSGSSGSGSVILSPSSTRTFSSGVIAADNLNVSAIGFRIRATSFPYLGSIDVALIMPSSVILYGPGGTTLTLNNFIASPTSPYNFYNYWIFGYKTTEDILIGATLNINSFSNVKPGEYTTSATYEIRINY